MGEDLARISILGGRIQTRKPFLKLFLAIFVIIPALSLIWNFFVLGVTYEEEVDLNDNFIADLDGDDPALIDHIRKHYLYPPSPRSEPYNLASPNRKDWSHAGQSQIANEIFKGKWNGVFFEAGGYDGETYSNSLYFEKYLNWTGVMVEPDYANIKRLRAKKRKSWLVKGCLSGSSKPQKLKFYGAMEIGALVDENLPASRKWLTALWRPVRETKVWCFPLISVLKAVNMTKIDYFVLDIEGAEIPVLENASWDKIHVDVMEVEYVVFGGAHWDKDRSARRLEVMREFMRRKFPDFNEYARVSWDLLYVRKSISGPREKQMEELKFHQK